MQLLLSVPIVLCTPSGHLGCAACRPHAGVPPQNGGKSQRLEFIKPTAFFQCVSSIPKQFMQSSAGTIRCAALQEIPVIALGVCRADKPPEQSLRAGCSGSGSRGSLFGFTQNCSPDQAPPGCLTKEQNKQVQVCAAAPRFPYGALCSIEHC